MSRFRRMAMTLVVAGVGVEGLSAAADVADVMQVCYLLAVADPSGELAGSRPSWRTGLVTS